MYKESSPLGKELEKPLEEKIREAKEQIDAFELKAISVDQKRPENYSDLKDQIA